MAYLALGNLGKSKQDLETFKKYEPNIHAEVFQNNKIASLNPFPLGMRVCAMFPEIKITVSQSKD